MINRFEITLSGGNVPTREVYASRKRIVAVELQCDCRPARFAVLATPLPTFDPESDFLFALVRDGESTRVEKLLGSLPEDVSLAADPCAFGAQLIAQSGMRF